MQSYDEQQKTIIEKSAYFPLNDMNFTDSSDQSQVNFLLILPKIECNGKTTLRSTLAMRANLTRSVISSKNTLAIKYMDLSNIMKDQDSRQ